MVKVLENRAVDLDIVPGSKDGGELKDQADAITYAPLSLIYAPLLSPSLPLTLHATPQTQRQKHSLTPHLPLPSGQATQNLPPEARQRAEGLAQGATGVGADALQTVGGGVKGVVDTAGNTVPPSSSSSLSPTSGLIPSRSEPSAPASATQSPASPAALAKSPPAPARLPPRRSRLRRRRRGRRGGKGLRIRRLRARGRWEGRRRRLRGARRMRLGVRLGRRGRRLGGRSRWGVVVWGWNPSVVHILGGWNPSVGMF